MRPRWRDVIGAAVLVAVLVLLVGLIVLAGRSDLPHVS
jgi:hypothetical protein